MATTAPPPPPGDGEFSIDFDTGVLGWGRGPVYTMHDLAPLRRAFLQRSQNGRRYEHNQVLQFDGDRQARRMCEQQWSATGDSKRDFTDKYEGRAATKTFLAYVADSQGLTPWIRRAGNGPATFNDHEKADVVEAIIGAVYHDCNGAAEIMEAVLRGFGIYYPVNDAEEEEIERVWGLARRALAGRIAVELEAERAAEATQAQAYEAYRLECWAIYYAQGGR